MAHPRKISKTRRDKRTHIKAKKQQLAISKVTETHLSQSSLA